MLSWVETDGPIEEETFGVQRNLAEHIAVIFAVIRRSASFGCIWLRVFLRVVSGGNVCKHRLGAMRKNNGKNIVNLTSTTRTLRLPFVGSFRRTHGIRQPGAGELGPRRLYTRRRWAVEEPLLCLRPGEVLLDHAKRPRRRHKKKMLQSSGKSLEPQDNTYMRYV